MPNQSNVFSTGIVSYSLFDEIYHDFFHFVEDVNLMSRYIVEMVRDEDASRAAASLRTLSEIEQEKLEDLLAKGGNEQAQAGGHGVTVLKSVDHVESPSLARSNPSVSIRKLKRLQNVAVMQK